MSKAIVVLEQHRSRFAARVRALDPKLLSALRVDDMVLTLLDVVVTVCRALNDQSDSRSWQERLDSCFTDSLADVDHDILMHGLQRIASDDKSRIIGSWVERVKSVGYTAFARRLLGAAEYDRLERTLKEDAAAVALAVRRGARAAMPFCVAWEDAVAIMTPDQLRAITHNDLLARGVLELVVDLDHRLGEQALPKLPMELTCASDADLAPLAADDLAPFGERLRVLVAEDSTKRVSEVNAYLVRKIIGARQALELSADGVSQAANSLIELIDRLLRQAYSKETVLAWVESNRPGQADLWFQRTDGTRAPTKRAEALCFVYGGGKVARVREETFDGSDRSLLHEVLAGAIVVARAELQILKHADADDDADREKLRLVLASVEGILMLALRLGWPSAAVRPPSDSPNLSETA